MKRWPPPLCEGNDRSSTSLQEFTVHARFCSRYTRSREHRLRPSLSHSTNSSELQRNANSVHLSYVRTVCVWTLHTRERRGHRNYDYCTLKSLPLFLVLTTYARTSYIGGGRGEAVYCIKLSLNLFHFKSTVIRVCLLGIIVFDFLTKQRSALSPERCRNHFLHYFFVFLIFQ